MAKIYYNALKNGKAYIDQGAAAYEHQYREWALKGLRRRAEQLGFDLIPTMAT